MKLVMEKGTKGDRYTKEIIERILSEGCMDKNPVLNIVIEHQLIH